MQKQTICVHKGIYVVFGLTLFFHSLDMTDYNKIW